MNPDLVFVALVASSFLAAVFGAAFSAGGALIVLAITSAVLPISAIVPIHSTLLVGASLTRIGLFWPDIDWSIVRPFLLGSVIGVLIGARTYVELPDTAIATAIGIVMLAVLWLPQIKWRPKIAYPWFSVGFLHSLLSTLFAYGAVLHAVILHTKLTRPQLVGTMAGCVTAMSLMKIAGYAWFGFDYSPYISVIVAGLAAALFGSWLGKKAGGYLSERWFRLIYRVLVTVTALRLLYVAIAANL